MTGTGGGISIREGSVAAPWWNWSGHHGWLDWSGHHGWLDWNGQNDVCRVGKNGACKCCENDVCMVGKMVCASVVKMIFAGL